MFQIAQKASTGPKMRLKAWARRKLNMRLKKAPTPKLKKKRFWD